MSATITLKTLPSGRVLAVCQDGPYSFASIHDFEQRAWPQESIEWLTQALLGPTPPVQSNSNIIKFPKYRRQCKGYEEE